MNPAAMNAAASASQPPPSPSCLRCPGWRHVLSFSSYLSGAPGRSVSPPPRASGARGGGTSSPPPSPALRAAARALCLLLPTAHGSARPPPAPSVDWGGNQKLAVVREKVQVVQMSMDGSFFTERYSGLLDCKRGNGPAKEEKG
ncbi:hypothetical protein EJB05_24530, partial [Eragrostis curvula]